ncbi:MAG: nucleotidyltransferase family protein [Clostridiales bacterium]
MKNGVYDIEEIKQLVIPIAKKHGVSKVYIFGSYARGEAISESDIDLLVDIKKRIGMFALGSLYGDLEDVLQRQVDLITVNAIKERMKDGEFEKNFYNEVMNNKVKLYEQ